MFNANGSLPLQLPARTSWVIFAKDGRILATGDALTRHDIGSWMMGQRSQVSPYRVLIQDGEFQREYLLHSQDNTLNPQAGK